MNESSKQRGRSNLGPVVESEPLNLKDGSSSDYQPRCSLDMLIRYPHSKSYISFDYKTLRLQRFSGKEGFSQPFSFSLDVRADDYTSSGLPAGSVYGQYLDSVAETSLNFESLMGAEVSVFIGLVETPEDLLKEYPQQRPVSCFNGIISSFGMADRGKYQLTMEPKINLLQHQNDYRIHQGTVEQVIKALLDTNKVKCQFRLRDASRARYRNQDWLQAGESDFEFIHRLSEKVGLFYYFIHTTDSHTVVFCDDASYEDLKSWGTDNPLELYLSYSTDGIDTEDRITAFTYTNNLTTSAVSTQLADTHAVWESQSLATAEFNKLSKPFTIAGNITAMHRVSYGASKEELEERASQTKRQLLSSRISFDGSSTCPQLRAGHTFTVRDRQTDSPETYEVGRAYPSGADAPLRPELNNLKVVLSSVEHTADISGSYSNKFSSYSADGYGHGFPGPPDQGDGVWAVVCESPKKGEEISYPAVGSSELYLKKSDFPVVETSVFRVGQKVEDFPRRGLYVRFTTAPQDSPPVWASLSQAMTTVPEIGAFVLIGRSRDDTEVPEIQQTLEAHGSKSAMPSMYSQSTNWGDSYSVNFGDSARLSFSADAGASFSDAVSLVSSAVGKYSDVSFGESSSFNASISPRAHSVNVTGLRGDAVAITDLASDPEGINPLVYVQYSRSETFGNTFSRNKQIGDSESHSFTDGNVVNREFSYGSKNTESFDFSDSTSMSEQSGNQSSVSVITGPTFNSVTQTSAATSLNNSETALNSNNTGLSAAVNMTGASSDISHTGVSNQISFTELSNGSHTTLVSLSESYTGVSIDDTITDVSVATHVTGTSLETNVKGPHVEINMIGPKTSIDIDADTMEVRVTGPGTKVEENGDTPAVKMTSISVNMIVGIKIEL